MELIMNLAFPLLDNAVRNLRKSHARLQAHGRVQDEADTAKDDEEIPVRNH